ncbi:ribosomal protein L1 [Hygrophoropsis aurantiaca]|uniref:Ribosomal protein L1 n=1 Tax=Hygrophoropsis aurantiaca TaxID=72124 RepID=A0ACB8ATM6_9AGAM|nr:ribosomal protein L1 [Hygrophoropsis aurantiaca]
MASLSSICRRCYNPFNIQQVTPFARQFSTSPVALARQVKKIPVLSKRAIAAKAKRRALKARRHIYEHEKMPLMDAIAVLRAVEVAKPNSTYEMVIRTAMSRGSAVPKGRINLPREAKPKTEDRILVFAEGRQADEAKRAGAHIVGGIDLADGVINGRHQATTILCTPALIRAITPKLGRILGPRGLMPSERRGTVTDDIAGYIRRLSGTTEWRGDKSGTIRMPIAKMHFPVEDVIKNVRMFVTSVKRVTGNQKDTESTDRKSKSVKPVNAITRILLKSSQAPSIQISDL